MGRKSHPLWHHFKKVNDTNYKTQRAQCNHCSTSVSNTPSNMRNHLNNCNQLPKPRTLSRGNNSYDSSSNNASSTSSTFQQYVTDIVTTEKKNELNVLLSQAIHQTATPFSFFDHPSWVEFFKALRPSWNLPPPMAISGELLDTCYKDVMRLTIEKVKEANGGILSIDGSTDRIGNSKCNIILHCPLPYFVGYLASDLKRDTTPNVIEKIVKAMKELDDITGIKSTAAFISDSCNGMRDVRLKLLEKH